jgi:hypothetical protein
MRLCAWRPLCTVRAAKRPSAQRSAGELNALAGCTRFVGRWRADDQNRRVTERRLELVPKIQR